MPLRRVNSCCYWNGITPAILKWSTQSTSAAGMFQVACARSSTTSPKPSRGRLYSIEPTENPEGIGVCFGSKGGKVQIEQMFSGLHLKADARRLRLHP